MLIKGKNIFRLLCLILIILFLALYFGQYTGYYDISKGKKTALTEEAIERFEKDVASGKEISAENYLEKEKNYNNNISRLGIGTSNLIEKGFDKIMSFIFKEVERAIKE